MNTIYEAAKQIADNTSINQSLLRAMEVPTIQFTNEIFDLIRDVKDYRIIQLGETALKKYLQITTNDYETMSSSDFYLIARILFKAIEENNYSVFKDRQFIYNIHQILSKLIRTSDRKEVLTNNLIAWLKDITIYPTSRNFAAFELGMSKCNEAIGDLLNASCNNEEDHYVRNYALMAIGMINDNRVLPELVNLYNNEFQGRLKETIAHVIYFISHKSTDGKIIINQQERADTLKEQLKMLYELLGDYENILILENDPKQKMKTKLEIKEIRLKIENVEKELGTI